jgi:hypothetical protein
MVQYYQHTALAEIDDATTELELYEVFYGLLGDEPMAFSGVGCNMRMLQLRVAPSELGLRDYNWTQTMWPSPHNAINCSANCTNSRSAITQPITSYYIHSMRF